MVQHSLLNKILEKILLFPGGGPLFLLVCVLKKNSGKIFGNFGVVLVIYIHNTYIMLDRIIKESISRVIIEKLEIESFGNIDLDAIAKKMFSMYNSGGGNDIIKMNGNTYYLSIQINPNETRKGSGGFFGNDIFFSFPPRMDFSVNYFKSLIAHELTHAFNKGKAYPYRRPSHSYLKFSFSTNTPNDFNIIDCVQDISYRLWDEDERTAYLTSAYLGVEEAKKYISRLRMEIRRVEEDTLFDDKSWFSLLQTLGVLHHLKGRGKNLKKKFIDKSKYLLNWYTKKLMSNAYRLENNY